jgi:hypothetical protein
MAPIPKVNVNSLPTVSTSPAQAPGRFLIKRIDGVTVTRLLPETISAREAASGGNRTPGSALMPPTIEVPGVDLDYPVVDVPTQAEFDEAVKNNPPKKDKSDTSDEEARAKDLAAKPPVPAVLQAITPVNPLIQADAVPINPANIAIPTATPGETAANAATTANQVSLPFLGTVPMPSKEALTLASTTAVTATFVAVLGKAGLEASMEGMKPLARIAIIRVKKLMSGELTHTERQLDFAHQLTKKNQNGPHSFVGDFIEYVRKHTIPDLLGLIK